MDYTVSEVLQFVQDNDVKFIRLAFCDIFGTLKNIAVMASELPDIFCYGKAFDASAVRGFMYEGETDLLLFPDPSTLVVLPWRPSQGRVALFFCDIRHPNGEVFDGDGRFLLKTAIARCAQMGYTASIGTECFFYLFETDEKGRPTNIPFDQAGFFDVAPLDKGENIRRQICLSLEEMGLHPESSHHEQGPGQNVIDFRHSDPLHAADHMICLKSAVQSVSAVNGLYASMMPKPLPGESGNGVHLNLSVMKDGENIFQSPEKGLSATARQFIAGVLSHIREITLFLNPVVESYRRLGSSDAPKFVTWSWQNRAQLIRVPVSGQKNTRIELRSPDSCMNPYVAFALVLLAGLDGISCGMPLCESTDVDLHKADQSLTGSIASLPQNLGEAAVLARDSAFVQQIVPRRMLKAFVDAKLYEYRQSQQ